MAKLVLGVCGSVAAYRACDLARELMRAGFEVRVCLTDSAQKFVTPALFEALTGQPCLIDAFEEPERGRMAHIDWARAADVIVVAPATASILGKLAHGVADDMLSTIALATTAPMVIAPAMNPTMYASDAVQSSLRTLESRAAMIVEPETGDVACGENGQGKFPSVDRIVASVLAVGRFSELLKGQKVLITSGPTQEPMDDVRFLSNRSSGKMGHAVARAAMMAGAEVTLVSGPVSSSPPMGVNLVRVRTAEEMLQACLSQVEGQDWIVGVAAVADYRPDYTPGKTRRSSETKTIALHPNPDIIAALTARLKPGAHAIAFAAEPSQDPTIAREKMSRKGVAALAMNDISSPGLGFESDSNQIHLLFAEGDEAQSPVAPKLQVAHWLWEQLVSHLSSAKNR